MDSMLRPAHSEWEAMLKLQIVELMAAFVGGGLLIAANELQMPWEDRLAMLCAVGGILGSAFSVLVSTPKTHREALLVFMGNSIAAYAWGPWAIEWICQHAGWSLTGRTAIGMSATIGATATPVLKPFIAMVWTKLVAWVSSLSVSIVIARVFGLKLAKDKKPNGTSVLDDDSNG